MQKKYSDEVARSGLKIRIVERAGKSIKSFVQRSDPFTPKNCGQENCLLCRSEGKGSCRIPSVTYNIKCLACKDDIEAVDSVYEGETSENCYVRGKQHLYDLEHKSDRSSLWRHSRDKHNGIAQNFQMSQTGSYKNDAMLRQIMEAVRISNSSNINLLNSKKEWNNFQLAEVVLGGRNNSSQ